AGRDVVVDEIGHPVACYQAVARREIDAQLPFFSADTRAQGAGRGLVHALATSSPPLSCCPARLPAASSSSRRTSTAGTCSAWPAPPSPHTRAASRTPS